MNSINTTDFTQMSYSFNVCLYLEHRIHYIHKLIKDGSSNEFNPITSYKPKPVRHREWLRPVSVSLRVEI